MLLVTHMLDYYNLKKLRTSSSRRRTNPSNLPHQHNQTLVLQDKTPPHSRLPPPATPHATASRTSSACSHTHAVYASYDSYKKRQRSYIDTKNKFKSRTLLGISIYLKRVYLLCLFFSNTALIWSIAFCVSLLGCRTALIL